MFVRAFEPDEDYDHDLASDGVSRYGAYLAHHRRRFAGDGQPTADAGEFAAAAWQIAQPPIMVPPYVRTHGRVQDTSVRWDEDRHLAACVELAVSSPPEAASLASPWRGWTRDEHGRWLTPVDFAHPHAVAVLRVAVPLAGVSLQAPQACLSASLPAGLHWARPMVPEEAWWRPGRGTGEVACRSTRTGHSRRAVRPDPSTRRGPAG